MYLERKLKGKLGKLKIKIEGFYLERFVNLVRSSNIEFWNIKQIDQITITANLKIKDYKKIKKIANKTKCKVEIIKKEGYYFTVHRYRKRKMLVYSFFLAFVLVVYTSSLVWNIKIEGNSLNTKKDINNILVKNNIEKFRFKKKIDIKKATNMLRVNLKNVSYATIEIRGTTVYVKLIEDKMEEVKIKENIPTNIIAKKTCIVTKVIAENGTRVVNQDMQIEKNQIAILGVIESKFKESKLVKAKGILRGNVKYVGQKKINLNSNYIIYTGKKYYFPSFYINNKEIILNYLRNSQKYDITKEDKILPFLNIKYNIYKAKKIKNQNINIDLLKAKNILAGRIDAEIKAKMKNDEKLVNKVINYSVNKNQVIANYEYILNENVAKEVNLEITEMEE